MLLFMDMIDEPSDKEKFRELYEEHHRLMYVVAYKIVRNEEDAKDAIQDALIRVAKNIHKIENPSSIAARNYLMVITKNAALNVVKKRDSKIIERLGNDLYVESCHSPGPAELHMQKEIIELAGEAILSLPERYRDCLYLDIVEGYRSREIAELLGIKDCTVRKRQQRGRQLLRELLKERGIIEEGEKP